RHEKPRVGLGVNVFVRLARLSQGSFGLKKPHIAEKNQSFRPLRVVWPASCYTIKRTPGTQLLGWHCETQAKENEEKKYDYQSYQNDRTFICPCRCVLSRRERLKRFRPGPAMARP